MHISKYFLLCTFFIVFGVDFSLVEGLGVNWGQISTHQLPPDIVVGLLKDNGIKKVKFFDVDKPSLSALAGTGIEVMIAVPNLMLASVNDYNNAKEWVKENVTSYINNGVNITYVTVGNEPFLKAYTNLFTNTTFPALKNIQMALAEAGHGNTIKATIPLNADVYDTPLGPSSGKFRDDIVDLMTQIVEFLNQTASPFMVNIYPFLSLYYSPDFPIDYAFFDGTSNPVIDGKLEYTNAFDGNCDTLVSALKKVGFGDLPIVVGEIGWPTDGDIHANASLAERFYKGLTKKLATNKGTPLRPNTYIEVFVFGLFDEDAKSVLPGDFERHWGIFTYDGQPKFPLDLSGKDEKNSLVAAKNVQYLPKQWCVLNPAAKNLSKLEDNMNFACNRGDCTSLAAGSSCNGLDKNGKASYAFNMYYQMQNQTNDSCNFEGLANITTTDPSQGGCNFIVQINNYVSSNSKTTPHPSTSTSSTLLAPLSLALFLGVFSSYMNQFILGYHDI